MHEVFPYTYSFSTFVTKPPSKKPKKSARTVNAFQKQGGAYKNFAMGGCLLGGLIFFLGFFAMAVSTTLGAIMIGGGILGGWLWYYVTSLYWRMAVGAAYGVPQCLLSSADVRPGDSLTVVYSQVVLKDLELLGGEFQLVVREAVEYRCGTDTCHEEHDQIVDVIRIMPKRLMKGISMQEKATFKLPENAMPTFASSNNKIGWLIRVMFESDKVKKYDQLYYFNVVQ